LVFILCGCFSRKTAKGFFEILFVSNGHKSGFFVSFRGRLLAQLSREFCDIRAGSKGENETRMHRKNIRDFKEKERERETCFFGKLYKRFTTLHAPAFTSFAHLRECGTRKTRFIVRR